MAQEKKKVEIEYVPAVREFDNTRNLIVNISDPTNKQRKFEILWEKPVLADGLEVAEAFAKSRYDCELQDIVDAGIRAFSTRPDYPSALAEFDKDGKLVGLRDGGHERAQGLADIYTCGRKASDGQSVKAKAKQADQMNEKLAAAGVANLDELLAKAREMGLVQ